MIWHSFAIGEVAQVNPKLAAGDRPDPNEEVSFVPMAAVSGETMSIAVHTERPYYEVSKGYTPFKRGDVLVAKITPCFENGKMAIAEDLPHELGFGTTEFHVFRPSERVTGRYLFNLLRVPSLRTAGALKMRGAAGQRRVPADFLASIEIPLPPLPEQKRIAGILDAADALRANRREALAQLDTLIQSTFLDMFGDPVKSGWPMVTVEAVAISQSGAIRTGPFGSQLLHSEFVDEGIRVLGIDNAVANEFREGKPRFITAQKYEKLRRYTVRPQDVLITIMGTCGRCAVVPDDICTAINTKHLCCITLDNKKCLPEFMHAYFLEHPIARRYLEQRAKGAIMSGLNMKIIKALPIPAVPLDLQHRFAAIVQSVERQRMRQRAHLSELDTLFASLQSRAFQGAL